LNHYILDTPIEFLKGVGPQRADLLRKELKIFFFGDLIRHYPFRYIDRTEVTPIKEINTYERYVQFRCHVLSTEIIGEKAAKRLVVHVTDGSGLTDLVFFQGLKWIRDKYKPGQELLVFGKPNEFKGRFNFVHPETDLYTEELEKNAPRLQAHYHSTEKLKLIGLDSKGIGKLMKVLLAQLEHKIAESLPTYILNNLKLLGSEAALIAIHNPPDDITLKKAQLRLKFEELFLIQIRLLKQKANHKQTVAGFVFPVIGDTFNNFYNHHLPFQLTDAQKRVLKEIRKDLSSGKHMNRLVQGDVGSGKTIVALLSMLMAIDNGFQACMMAPTEILATQHYNGLSELLASTSVKCALLTGSTRKSERKKIDEQLRSGELNILIGTHALIEEAVVFKNLGIAIIDEQHRFGVQQRYKLWRKNTCPPHVLVMTATPIPRTLAMTLYGDLDISVIDQLPAGRKPISTFHKFDSSRLWLFGFMKQQIAQGRQIYVVYPLIEESEKLDLKHLMDGYESIVREFQQPQYQVSVVHGKMKAADKEYEMQRFIKKETQIMVATTVIEVGVNVPNASVMVIENAERFGLSQLHQLRGRVGRGAEQSYCILMSGYKLSAESRERLNTMVATNNGFEIAEVDLKLRGPGDIEGTRQSGVLDLKLADLAKDTQILALARNTAEEILNEDPELKDSKNNLLSVYITNYSKSRPVWSRVS
jgi:ATP-dependent DNA helicase RecG